jgi:hypothetical protein
MNLKTEPTSFEGPSLGRLLHLVTFVGAALVIFGMAAAVAANYFESEDRAASVVAGTAARITSSPTYGPMLPNMTFFLVDSLEQHDRVFAEQSDKADARAQAGAEERWFTVLLASTEAQEKEAWDHIDETKRTWMRCCHSSAINTVDLRTASLPDQRLPVISE